LVSQEEQIELLKRALLQISGALVDLFSLLTPVVLRGPWTEKDQRQMSEAHDKVLEHVQEALKIVEKL
jgi:hypothetical protein